MSLTVADAVDYKGFPAKSREPGIFVWEGLSCGTNIFIKTTFTHIYIYTHTFFYFIYTRTYIYTLFYLISYIYTHTPKKKSLVFSIKIMFDGDLL